MKFETEDKSASLQEVCPSALSGIWTFRAKGKERKEITD